MVIDCLYEEEKGSGRVVSIPIAFEHKPHKGDVINIAGVGVFQAGLTLYTVVPERVSGALRERKMILNLHHYAECPDAKKRVRSAASDGQPVI